MKNKELHKKPVPPKCRYIKESGPHPGFVVSIIVIGFILLFMVGHC